MLCSLNESHKARGSVAQRGSGQDRRWRSTNERDEDKTASGVMSTSPGSPECGCRPSLDYRFPQSR
jgi:hypothetical protein